METPCRNSRGEPFLTPWATMKCWPWQGSPPNRLNGWLLHDGTVHGRLSRNSFWMSRHGEPFHRECFYVTGTRLFPMPASKPGHGNRLFLQDY
jgi:hypothetical protein